MKLASAKTVGKSLNGKRRKKPEILAVAKLDRPPLTLQVLWGCRVYNSTPEEAAQTAVTDLLEYLSQGGVVRNQHNGGDNPSGIAAEPQGIAAPRGPRSSGCLGASPVASAGSSFRRARLQA